MTSRRVWALLGKDLRLHGRDIALTQVGIVVLIAMMRYGRPQDPSILASAVFMFNFLLAGYWGEWLITREKTKGTFAWLRSSPVSDRELVASKFAGVSLCAVALWVCSSTLFTWNYWFPSRAVIWLVLQVALLMFATFTAATRFRFGPKLGQLLPFGVAFVVLSILNLTARAGYVLPVDPEVLLRQPAGRALLGLALAFCCILSFSLTLAWVRRVDTEGLLE